jgi:hypothetical protein
VEVLKASALLGSHDRETELHQRLAPGLPETCTAFETIRDSSEARDCAREEQTMEFELEILEAPLGFEPGMEVLQI